MVRDNLCLDDGRVYNTIDTVPTVHGLDATELLLTIFIGGPLLRISAAAKNGRQRLGDAPARSWALVVALWWMQGRELTTIHSSIQQASAWCRIPGSLMAWRGGSGTAGMLVAPQLKGYQPAFASGAGIALSGGRDDRPRRILWPAYDRWDGCRQLTTSIMSVPNHRHDENVLSIDEIFQLKLTSAFINKPAKTIAYYLLSHLFPSSG